MMSRRSEIATVAKAAEDGRTEEHDGVRPVSFWRVFAAHAPLAAAAGLPLMWAVFLPRLPFPLHSCTFVALWGLPCPFCGVTRSFRLAASGAWLEALRFCPLGVLVFVALLFLLVWNLAALLAGRLLIPSRLFRFAAKHQRKLLAALGGIVLLNWGYRLFHGLC